MKMFTSPPAVREPRHGQKLVDPSVDLLTELGEKDEKNSSLSN
jgi:hypothetical protein